MKIRRRKLWILLGCAIAAVLLLNLWREREPQYQGRSLSQWIGLLHGGYSNELDMSQRDTEEAIRRIGTNGLPTLVKWLNYQERPWQTRLASLCSKLPEKVANLLSRLVSGRGEDHRQDAFSALDVLGAEAKPIIPALTNLLVTQPQHAYLTMAALLHIGDEGLSPVLCVLTNPANPARADALSALANPEATYTFSPGVADILTSCLDDADSLVAFRSAAILCMRQVNQERALQTFVAAIEDKDKQQKQYAASFLKDVLRTISSTNLIQILQDTNSALSPYAASALADKFENNIPNRTIIFSALTNALRDPRPLVRSCAADALGRLRTESEPAASALLNLWTDPDELVRRSGTNAFFNLPSCAIFRIDAQVQNGMSPELAEMFERRYRSGSLFERRYRSGSFSRSLTNLLNHPDVRIREMATNAFPNQTAAGPSH